MLFAARRRPVLSLLEVMMSEPVPQPSPKHRILGYLFSLVGGGLTFACLVVGIYTGINGSLTQDKIVPLIEFGAGGVLLLLFAARHLRRL